MQALRRWLPASLALAVVGGAVAWALAGLPGGPAACPAPGCDCEAPGSGPIRQPANAWSSLALATAGMILLLASPAGAGEASPQGAEGKARRSRRLDLLPAWALVFTGTAAFLFHAGLTAWAARLDGIAVGTLAATLAISSLPRGGGGGTPARRGRGSRRLRSAGHVISAWLPWLVLGLGGMCWALGRSGGPWCRPDSLLQAHALWHLLAAGAIYLWLRRRRAVRRGASPIPPRPLPSRP